MFTFYEFIPPKGEHLTDGTWRMLLRTSVGREARPTWIKSFRLPDQPSKEELDEEKLIQKLMDEELDEEPLD